MGYQRPPNVLTVRATTNGVAGTNNTTSLLGAPGAGFAYRIVGLALGADGGPDLIRALVGNIGLQTGMEWTPPEPGIPIAPNTTVFGVDICVTAATKFYNLTVLYFIDAV